jgi:hypothetical protein
MTWGSDTRIRGQGGELRGKRGQTGKCDVSHNKSSDSRSTSSIIIIIIIIIIIKVKFTLEQAMTAQRGE